MALKYIVSGNEKNANFKTGASRKKARQIFWKTNISYPLIRTRMCAYQGVRNVHFSENFACFFFLKHSFWDSHFCHFLEEIQYQKLKLLLLFSLTILKDIIRTVYSSHFYHVNERKLHDPIYCNNIASSYRVSMFENL